MTILIITGPPAAGKNSVANILARTRSRCAVIDVDQVRWMLVQPHAAPWEGDEGIRQCKFGVENACMLAGRFAATGYDVLLLDYLWNYTTPLYRANLSAYNIYTVQLLPTRSEILQRNAARGWVLTRSEVEMLYDGHADFTDFDERIDNTSMSVADLAVRLTALMDDH